MTRARRPARRAAGGDASAVVGRLLGLAANPLPSPAQRQLLADVFDAPLDAALFEEALMRHRMGPLLHWLLKQHGLQPPRLVARMLASLYLTYRQKVAARDAFVADMAGALAAADIEVVFLKGTALCHTAYAEPGLRPMDDIDLLVPRGIDTRVAEALASIGLETRLPETRAERLWHHWPLAAAQRSGTIQFVEVHTSVLNARLGRYAGIDTLQRPFQRFTIGGTPVLALHPEECLITQSLRFRHLTDPWRVLLIADMLGLAMREFERIDWQRLRRMAPRIRQVFRAFQDVTPLDPTLCAALGLDPAQPVGDVGLLDARYLGWPVNISLQGRDLNLPKGRLALETLLPDPWWSRLAYGVAPGVLGKLECRLLRHPVNLTQQLVRYAYHS
jgi:hypothetical protein